MTCRNAAVYLRPSAVYSLDGIFHGGYISVMIWEVEYTDEFGEWWHSLPEGKK